MAMYNGIKGPLQSTPERQMRTNTKLKVTNHDAPAEEFVVDPRLKRLFQYHFGGDGWVVIPKGRVVAIATDNGKGFKEGRLPSDKTGKLKPVLTLANGGQDTERIARNGQAYTAKANKPIGVAASIVYEEMLDGWNRMFPTVENEIYIELPYLPKKEDAEMLEWGVVYDADPASPLKHGDEVMSDANGRIIKADFAKLAADIEAAADLAELKTLMAKGVIMREQVIGQVWSIETELPTEGFLQWVGWTDDQTSEDDWRNLTGARPEDRGQGDGDFPGYPYEKTYRNWDTRSNKYYPQGIPGLTNGSNIEVDYADEFVGDVNPGQEGRHDFRLLHSPVVVGSAVFKYGTEVIQPIFLDEATGRVAFDVAKNDGNTPKAITVSYKATGQLPGVPTNADFKGSKGLVRILLQK